MARVWRCTMQIEWYLEEIWIFTFINTNPCMISIPKRYVSVPFREMRETKSTIYGDGKRNFFFFWLFSYLLIQRRRMCRRVLTSLRNVFFFKFHKPLNGRFLSVGICNFAHTLRPLIESTIAAATTTVNPTISLILYFHLLFNEEVYSITSVVCLLPKMLHILNKMRTAPY